MTARIACILAAMPGVALAHAGDGPHVHGSAVLPLVGGLGLIAVAAGTAVLLRIKAK